MKDLAPWPLEVARIRRFGIGIPGFLDAFEIFQKYLPGFFFFIIKIKQSIVLYFIGKTLAAHHGFVFFAEKGKNDGPIVLAFFPGNVNVNIIHLEPHHRRELPS
jgi:hypothetical protein